MNDHDEEPHYESMWMRLISMIIVGVLMGFAQSLFWVIAVAQFIIMLVNKREPNEQLSEFGTTMGVWMAKAHISPQAKLVKLADKISNFRDILASPPADW